MRPDYIKTKVGPNLWHVDDCGFKYYQDRQGNIYNPCSNCGELTPEGQLDDYEGNCLKCWQQAHSCYQCGEYNEKLHDGEDGHLYCDGCYIELLEECLQRRNNMIDIEKFYHWQQEKPDTRHVEIKITPKDKAIKVFVYDQELKQGQYVQSVNEIELENKYEAEQRAEYERLRAKFEEGAECQSISPTLVTNG